MDRLLCGYIHELYVSFATSARYIIYNKKATQRQSDCFEKLSNTTQVTNRRFLEVFFGGAISPSKITKLAPPPSEMTYFPLPNFLLRLRVYLGPSPEQFSFSPNRQILHETLQSLEVNSGNSYWQPRTLLTELSYGAVKLPNIPIFWTSPLINRHLKWGPGAPLNCITYKSRN